MSRGLNNLYQDEKFVGFGLPKWSPKINHLSYADDTILFRFGDKYSIGRMMVVLCQYEQVSSQMINKNKSSFYIHENTPLGVGIKLKRLTGIKIGIFPFTYLGCSVLHGRSKVVHFEELLRKIARRIGGWHNKFLTFRGKFVLVNHVLQSMPLYLLSVLNPPEKVIYQINKIFSLFSGVNWVELRANTGLNGKTYTCQRRKVELG